MSGAGLSGRGYDAQRAAALRALLHVRMTSGELAQALGVSSSRATDLLADLYRAGALIRYRRGRSWEYLRVRPLEDA